MPKSVVTGGAGFIGSNLVRALLHAGHEVVVLDNLSTGSRENLTEVENEIEFAEGDIRNEELLAELFRGVDYVYHQAALGSVPRSIEDPWTSHDNNVNGTLKVLLAARNAGVQRVICAASSSAYGNTPMLPKVETMPSTPLSPYAITKYVGEMYCEVFHRVYGLDAVAFRYFNVFGPRQSPDSQYAAVIPKWISALVRDESPVIHGDGEQTRDFTFIENVVRANLQATSAPAEKVAGQVFNIGCNGRISLNNLFYTLRDIIGRELTPTYTDPRAGDVRDSLADIQKAEAAFGYEPVVDLKTGLAVTVQWYQGQ